MNNTIKYIQSVFDDVNKIEEFNVTNIPMYLSDKYLFIGLSILGNDCILVKPKIKQELIIGTIEKDLNQIKRFTHRFPVFVFCGLRLSQRKTLIKNKIPFVVPEAQIFIPYPPISLTEFVPREKIENEMFKKSTQVIFAYLFLNNIETINAHRIAEKLGYSVPTANRALNELVDKGVLLQSSNGTRKKYMMSSKREFWEHGKQYLFNPVKNSFLILKNRVNIYDKRFFKSGDTALCEYSEIFDENANYEKHYACFTNHFSDLYQHTYPETIEFSMSSFVAIESMVYNPALLSTNGSVDVVTLYAQYLDKSDERVEIAFERIIEEIING